MNYHMRTHVAVGGEVRAQDIREDKRKEIE